MRYNNDTRFDDVVTLAYPAGEIEAFQQTLESGAIPVAQFSSKFNIQCTRKTFQGYYSVLKQDDGKHVFAFIDSNRKVQKVIVWNSFKNKSDFDFVVPNETKASEILVFDPNAVVYPISAQNATGHIVKDGLLVIRYSHILDGILLDDSVVYDIQFFDNKTLSSSTDNFWIANTPFIFPMDKDF